MKRFSLVLFCAIILIPLICAGQLMPQAPPKISFDFIDADIRNVLRVLAEVSKKNMVIADDVKGKITIKLENVSCDDALDIVLKNNDLAKAEDETVVRVMTAKKFYEERDRGAKDRLDFVKEREARQKLEQQFVTETVYINYADIADVEKMITGETSASAKDAALPPGAPGAEISLSREAQGPALTERRRHDGQMEQRTHHQGHERERGRGGKAHKRARHAPAAGTDQRAHSPGHFHFFEGTGHTVGRLLPDKGKRRIYRVRRRPSR